MEKVTRIINLIGSILLLNVIFLLTSALTLGLGIGTSWSALLAAFMELKSDDSGYYIRNYFKHWKEEFKETIIVNIVLLLVIVGSYFLITILYSSLEKGALQIIAFSLLLAALLEIGIIASFFYPVSVKFEGDAIHHIYLSFLFAHRYFYLSIPFAIAFIGSLYLIIYVSFAFLFIAFGGLAYIEAKIVNHLWRNYTYEPQA